MVNDALSDKNIPIPKGTDIKIHNEFISEGVEYIITLIRSDGYVEVFSKEECTKRYTYEKCDDGVQRSLKEIEELENNN